MNNAGSRKQEAGNQGRIARALRVRDNNTRESSG